MTNDPDIQRQYQEAMINMRDDYPEDYKGPKAGKSSYEEWIAIRDYDAYCYVANGTWSYSDFDCYLYSMCKKHYSLGAGFVQDTIEQMQKITKIRS